MTCAWQHFENQAPRLHQVKHGIQWSCHIVICTQKGKNFSTCKLCARIESSVVPRSVIWLVVSLYRIVDENTHQEVLLDTENLNLVNQLLMLLSWRISIPIIPEHTIIFYSTINRSVLHENSATCHPHFSFVSLCTTPARMQWEPHAKAQPLCIIAELYKMRILCWWVEHVIELL